MESMQEIHREKVFVPVNMNIKEIMEKYGVAETTARNSRKKGWLIKNYSRCKNKFVSNPKIKTLDRRKR